MKTKKINCPYCSSRRAVWEPYVLITSKTQNKLKYSCTLSGDRQCCLYCDRLLTCVARSPGEPFFKDLPEECAGTDGMELSRVCCSKIEYSLSKVELFLLMAGKLKLRISDPLQ